MFVINLKLLIFSFNFGIGSVQFGSIIGQELTGWSTLILTNNFLDLIPNVLWCV